MNISIERIGLRNFKGIKTLDVDFGNSTAILGQNATGKTTIFDAFLWCLFGKDSQNKADFEIKTLDGKGNQAHNLEHAVDVGLIVDGRPMLLSRVFTEKYTRKRGQPKPEMTGHTTDYFIDGVPLKEKEYQERIKAIIDEKVFRLLTDPRYFNEQLHWQDRRKILMEICGDVETADVIASDKSLAGLTSILNGHNIDDFKKMIASQKKEINDQLQKIPVRIDEASRSINEIRPDIDTVPGQIEALEAKKQELEAQLTDLRNGGALSAKRVELQGIEGEILRSRNEFEAGKLLRIAPIQTELNALRDAMSSARRKTKDLEDDIERENRFIEAEEKSIEGYRAQWIQADAQEFTGETHCYACKQALPHDKIEGARAAFNKQKAEKLASIDEAGKRTKGVLEGCRARVAEMVKELETLTRQEIDVTLEPRLVHQIAAIRTEQPDLSDLEEKKTAIQNEINNISTSYQDSIKAVEDQLSTAKSDLQALVNDYAKVTRNKETQTRIEELQAQEKDLAAQFEKLEANLFLIENFTRAKVKLIDRRINDKFSLARFRLFEDQINGGLSEVCETTLNGVPYNSINNAGRIQAGMDIIKTLQAYYNVTAPVWLDNAEAVIDVPEIPGQLIRLIVSGQDKTLRIEAGSDLKKAVGGN